ncbi:anaerobic magnesium-protoporphyrin IX monomethyl ester cyclase [Thermoflexales bacterium]|nr:anaerobic magnesium-protoporphyrin IX monomethyl ester cyclase [Thermoflexales bacterium]
MTDILFGQSYYLCFDPKLQAARQPYPPLGSMYAAAYLRARGYNVALFDAMLAASENEWAVALERHQPRFAVLYEDNFNYLSKMCLRRMREAAFTMIALAKARGCTVILCGADATDHAADYLARGADFVLIGEGEVTLGELLDRLTPPRELSKPHPSTPSSSPLHVVQDRSESAQDALHDILGLAWQGGHTPRRPDITQLDDLPFPAWDLIDVARYRAIWLQQHGYYSLNMVTTRGCPYHCNWCAKPIWGQRYHSRSPENVVAEMKWLKETYQPDHIWFADDIFGLRPGWIERFGQLAREQAAVIPFKCLSRADLIKPAVVAGLKSAGCQTIWIGAESGSQRILDAMEKGTTVQQIVEARRLLGNAGIEVAYFLQFGYPGETRADLEATLALVRATQPDDIGISVSYPLPGTKFYERVKAQLGEKQNWDSSADLAMLYQGPFTTEFYRQLHTVVHQEFRLHKGWEELKRVARQPTHWRLRQARLIAAALYRWITLPWARWRLSRLEHRSPQAVAPLPVTLSQQEAAQPSSQSRS